MRTLGSCSIETECRINPIMEKHAAIRTDFADLLREVDALMSQLAFLRSRLEAKAREHDRDRKL